MNFIVYYIESYYQSQQIRTSSIMIKKPNIVNMTLTSTKPFKSLQIQNDASISNSVCPQTLSDDTIIKDVMQFVQIITTQKTKLKAKEQRTAKMSKQGKRSPKKGLKQQAISIPIDLSLSVETVLRKYLLYKVEQKQENNRNGITRAKLFRQKNISLKNPFYKANKENTQSNQQLQQIEEDIFRSIATTQAQKQKLNAKISLLSAENTFLKQSIEEKNQTISKLLLKQAQMKKKYTDQITRITRNKNIYNISAGFDRQETQGKFLMSITGRHVKQNNLQEDNHQKESIALHGGVEGKILPRSGSDYLKSIKSNGQIDMKKHFLKGYKKNIADSNLIQNMNKTLQIEQGTQKELQFSIKKVKNNTSETKDKSLPNYFQGFTDSPKIFEEQNVFENYSKQNVEVIQNMKQEEFQALQQKGFYVQNAQKSVEDIA